MLEIGQDLKPFSLSKGRTEDLKLVTQIESLYPQQESKIFITRNYKELVEINLQGNKKGI